MLAGLSVFIFVGCSSAWSGSFAFQLCVELRDL